MMPPMPPVVVSPPVPPLAAPPLAGPGGGTNLPGVPPAVAPLPQPAAPPPAPEAPLPPIAPDATLKKRLPPEKITNPFERQAAMIVETANDWAKRLAANLGDHAADQAPVDSSTVHEMWNHSKYGVDAPRVFWERHDELLQLAMQNNDPDPYAVAERGALAEVYPYREKLALLDQLAPEQKVARAEQLLAMTHREIAKGNPPNALPHIVGPAGLPQPEQQPKGGY